jgi:hypothetical protein
MAVFVRISSAITGALKGNSPRMWSADPDLGDVTEKVKRGQTLFQRLTEPFPAKRRQTEEMGTGTFSKDRKRASPHFSDQIETEATGLNAASL